MEQLEKLFQEWSKKLYDDKRRDNIVKFAFDYYEHAELIVSQTIKKVESKYVSRLQALLFTNFTLWYRMMSVMNL